MKTSCSLHKSKRLFALSLTLMAALCFGTLNTVRKESTRPVVTITDQFTIDPTLLFADGQETHGGHGGHDGHDGGGQESHGGKHG